MGMNISKGQKADLTKNNAGLRSVLVGMGWQANSAIDLDTAAFLLGAGGKVAGDADFVFYGNALRVRSSISLRLRAATSSRCASISPPFPRRSKKSP